MVITSSFKYRPRLPIIKVIGKWLMSTKPVSSECKFPDLYPDQCHRCGEFRWNYFVDALKCAYVIRPAVKHLLDKKKILLGELDACFEIIRKPLATVFKIKNKPALKRVGAELREIDAALESL